MTTFTDTVFLIEREVGGKTSRIGSVYGTQAAAERALSDHLGYEPRLDDEQGPGETTRTLSTVAEDGIAAYYLVEYEVVS